MSRSVYRYNVSLCYLCVSLTVSVVSVKRQEVTETAKSVTETSRTYRNFTMAVLYSLGPRLNSADPDQEQSNQRLHDLQSRLNIIDKLLQRINTLFRLRVIMVIALGVLILVVLLLFCLAM